MEACKRLQILSLIICIAGLIVLLSCMHSYKYQGRRERFFQEPDAKDPNVQSCEFTLSTVYQKSDFPFSAFSKNAKDIAASMSPQTSVILAETGYAPTIESACKIPEEKMSVFNFQPLIAGSSECRAVSNDGSVRVVLPYTPGDSMLNETPGCMINLNDYSPKEVDLLFQDLYKLQHEKPAKELDSMNKRLAEANMNRDSLQGTLQKIDENRLDYNRRTKAKSEVVQSLQQKVNDNNTKLQPLTSRLAQINYDLTTNWAPPAPVVAPPTPVVAQSANVTGVSSRTKRRRR